MKKIYSYILLSLLVIGIISCGENEDFSKKHELTDDEIAEIARQDSIKIAEKERINANLVLNYEVEVTISATQYAGAPVAIEVEKIATLFGISVEDLLAGIAEESGAPEIKGFAIDFSTRADYANSSNTNSTWGHWWDANGDVINWGEGAMVAAEFNPETGDFNVAQFPGRLVEGQTIKVIEALKYNDLRVAVVITVKAVAPQVIVASVVSTQNLTLNTTPKSAYDAEPLKFDLGDVLSSLGVSSMDEVNFIGVNQDGTYNQEPVTGKGYWYDMNGYVGSWGDDASVYTNYGDFEEDEISIGQFPDRLTAGLTLNLKYGFIANNKIVMLNITINIVGYQDPETPPTGEPENLTLDVELSKVYSDDYASVKFDIKETMRNAFKMTTYQIFQAVNSGSLKLYQGEVSSTDPAYTADVPGYWLTTEGIAAGWGESVVWCSVGRSETELFLYGGNHPGNATSGMVVKTTLIATCNGGSVTFNLTFSVN
jgi:hypothetical protein